MKTSRDVTVGGANPLVLCVVGLFSAASFFCLCLLILYKREQACAVLMCPLALSLGFPPLFTVSILPVFVAFVMGSCRGGCLLLWIKTAAFTLRLALGTFLGDCAPQRGDRGNITYTIIYNGALTFVCAIVCAGLLKIVCQLYNVLLSHSGGCGGIFLPEIFLGAF